MRKTFDNLTHALGLHMFQVRWKAPAGYISLAVRAQIEFRAMSFIFGMEKG